MLLLQAEQPLQLHFLRENFGESAHDSCNAEVPSLAAAVVPAAGRAFIGSVSCTSGELDDLFFAEVRAACCLVPDFTVLDAFLAAAGLEVAALLAAREREAVACT